MLARHRARARVVAAVAAGAVVLSWLASQDPSGSAAFDATALPGADSPPQAEMLADGEVTFVEYERAVRSAIECLEAAGVAVDGPHRSERRGIPFLDFAYGGGPERKHLAEAEAVYESCWLTYGSAVAEAYAYQNRPTPAEFRRQRSLIVDCLARHGAEVSQDVSWEQLHTVLDEDDHAGRCLAEVVRIMNAEATTAP